MEILIEPFRYEFFRTGLAAVTLAGFLCGLVGVYVVLRHMSYIGHGLSHAIFGGAVASFVANINFYLGAGLWGLVSALMINSVARRRKIGADAAIGVITTASFAIGVALISRYRSFTRDFEAALWGYATAVTFADLAVLIAVVLGAVLVIFFQYRALLFATFDPEVAEVSGLKTARIDALFSFVLAATVLSTMRILGVLLIAAALVTPAVVARMLTDRFSKMLFIAALLGALAGFGGMYLSYYLDVAPGAAVVLVGAAAFIAVYAITSPVRRHRIPSGAMEH